jgi:hypothetical protein
MVASGPQQAADLTGSRPGNVVVVFQSPDWRRNKALVDTATRVYKETRRQEDVEEGLSITELLHQEFVGRHIAAVGVPTDDPQDETIAVLEMNLEVSILTPGGDKTRNTELGVDLGETLDESGHGKLLTHEGVPPP